MKPLSGYLFLSLIAGSWHSVELETEEFDLNHFQTTRSARYCFRTSSGKICITLFLANRPNEHPQFCNCFVAANPCNQKSEAISHMEEIETDLREDAILLETFGTRHGPTMLFPAVRSHHWPGDVTCMKSNDESSSSDKCYGNVSALFRYTCPDSEETTPDALVTEVITTDKMQSSTPEDFNSSSNPSSTASLMSLTRSEETTPDALATKVIITTDEMRSSTPEDLNSSTASLMSLTRSESSSVSLFRDGEPSDASNTTGILLIGFLFMAVICIVVAVILVIQKCKFANRHEVSPLKKTDENDAASPELYEAMTGNRNPVSTTCPCSVYTELELTQQPTPTDGTIYYNLKPTGKAVDTSVIYVNSQV